MTEHETAFTFSVIIPTAGRASLRRTLRSLRREDLGDIEIIVVADGSQPNASEIAREASEHWPAVRYFEGPRTRNWGNAQRMFGIEQATGRYLMFVDDDDITKRGAFGGIRRAVQTDPGRMILFRMKRHGEILWREPRVAFGNVSTQQVVVPNIPGRVGSWLTNDRYQSDLDFITECVELQGEPVWNREVIAIIDPFSWLRARAWLKPRLNRWRVRLMIGVRLRRLLHRTAGRPFSDS